MKAEIISEVDALQELESAWWRLWSRQTQPVPFTTPAWLIPWWRAFAPGHLMSVAIWHEGSLVALAPLYLEQGPSGGRLLPLGMSLSDYSDILIDPACALDAARELTAALELFDWECWSAEEAQPGAAVLDLELPLSWSEHRATASTCPVLDLPEAPQELAAVVPARMLRKYRMAGHRLSRRPHGFASAVAGDLDAMLQDLFSLHEARWRSRGQGGVLLDPRVRRFHLSAAPRLLDAGLLKLRSLIIEGRVAGLYYGMQDSRRAYAYLGGFDPAFGFESPGTILIGAALEDAMAAGCGEFDFLRGQESYKFGWGASARCNTRRTFSRRAGR